MFAVVWTLSCGATAMRPRRSAQRSIEGEECDDGNRSATATIGCTVALR